MSNAAKKVYPYNLREQIARSGHRLVASCELPHDPHLQVVLCHLPENELTPFVVWYFNKECGGFGQGDYCRNILSAAFAYVRRCMRYGGKPGEGLPSEDEIKAADKQLFPKD